MKTIPMNRAILRTLAMKGKSILEIGPYLTPFLRGPKVRYLDVLSKEDMIARAAKDSSYSYNPELAPDKIDYVIDPLHGLSDITERFDVVFSSHNIEHQVDFIGHLREIARILEPSGRYYLCIPDKRFCFDHFKATSCFTEMIDFFKQGRKIPSLGKVLYNNMFKTHNNPVRHWLGESDTKYIKASVLRDYIKGYAECTKSNKYIDIHNWYFVPKTFQINVTMLYALGYIPLFPVFVSETSVNGQEFYASLVNLGYDKNIDESFSSDAFLQFNHISTIG